MIRWVQNIRYSLMSKLILSVGATLLVSISVWAYYNLRIQKERLMQHILKDTVRLCNTIKLGTHYAMMTNSRDDINQIINNIASQKEIRNIRIYNKKGQIKFSNRIGEVDEFTNIKAEACDVCHKADPPLTRLELSRRTRLFYGEEGGRFLGILTSIQNEPGCAAGPCHVHDRDQAVLGAIDVVFSLTETYTDIDRFERGIISLAAVVFLLTSGMIAFIILKFLRAPIHQLIQETDEIAKGRYDTVIKVDSEDEIGQLARAVNKMSEEISRNEAELKKQKEEYRNLFDHVPCEITVQDQNFRLLQYNNNFARKFNPKPGDFCYHAYKGLNDKCLDCPLEKTFVDGRPHYGEETGTNKAGQIAHWILVTAPIRNARGEIEAAMEMSIDITNTRILENQLHISEQKYQAIFNNIPHSVFVLDSNTLEIRDCNQSVETIYGFTRKELIKKTFMALFFEDERKKYGPEIHETCEINRVRHRHKEGRPLYVNIRISRSEYAGRAELLVTTNDITKRLEAEQQLIQASKIATLGEMAAGIAHELNQPLSVIKTASNYFIKKIDKNEPIDPEIQKTLATEIDSYINRATRIINHMREFGRKSDMQLVSTPINEIIQRAFDMFSQQLKVRGIDVLWDLEKELPPILGDPGRLEQVFINLLINARDAVESRWEIRKGREDGGFVPGAKQIRIRTRRRNHSVCVEVEDSGHGIPEHLIDKIFEPFFTTKEVGKGTGLGLSITYNIVKDCNGTIQARSGRLDGACFELRFPVHEAVEEEWLEYGTSTR
ncbi:MAG: PAS domain S-box protein [Thermodesulfobacteriota bacterium]